MKLAEGQLIRRWKRQQGLTNREIAEMELKTVKAKEQKNFLCEVQNDIMDEGNKR